MTADPKPTGQTADDEIDLAELALALWRGRVAILLAMGLALLLAVAFLHLAERKYTVSLVLKPMQEPSSRSNLSGFAGLAGLAGIDLPSGSDADFSAFPLMLKSRDVAERLVGDAELMQRLFEAEWDAEAGAWRAPARSALGAVVAPLKTVLTGEGPADYRPPDAARLAERINRDISASIDTKSGLLNISTEAADPDLFMRLLDSLVVQTDALFRERFIAAGSSGLDFYKLQLAQARSTEHREALARMIVNEEQKLMLATRSTNYVAEPLTGPDVSLEPTSPRPALVLALATVLGLMGGCGGVLLRNAFLTRRAT